MPSLRTDDGRTLAWRELGSGPPLLCHPGGPGCSSRYFGDLPELAAERTLLLLDPRGAGESDRPANPSGYDLEDYAADVEAVRAHLGVERLDLLGHSHGGFVAMNWAASNPERVGKLVLASSAPRFTDAIRKMRIERVASHQGQPYFEDAIDALMAHQEGRFETDAELSALYEREWRVFVPLGFDATGVVDALAAAGNNADALRHFNSQIADRMDLRPGLTKVKAPTLVIAGVLDAFGRAPGEEIAAALPKPILVILPDLDHFPFLESAEHRVEWSRVVLDYLTA